MAVVVVVVVAVVVVFKDVWYKWYLGRRNIGR